MNDLEQKNLLRTEAQVSDELSFEDLEEVAGGGAGLALGFGLIGVGASFIAGFISGKSLRESAGDAINAGVAGVLAGALAGPV